MHPAPGAVPTEFEEGLATRGRHGHRRVRRDRSSIADCRLPQVRFTLSVAEWPAALPVVLPIETSRRHAPFDRLTENRNVERVDSVAVAISVRPVAVSW